MRAFTGETPETTPHSSHAPIPSSGGWDARSWTARPQARAARDRRLCEQFWQVAPYRADR
jgi:hypothetical protein